MITSLLKRVGVVVDLKLCALRATCMCSTFTVYQCI